MKHIALTHLLLAVSLLTGCGGSGGGGSDNTPGPSSTTSTPSTPAPPASNDAVALPAVALSGVTSTVRVQPAAGATSTTLVIDGMQWSPVCANQAGIAAINNPPGFAVDQACLANLSVFEVSNVVLGNAEAKSKIHAIFTPDLIKSGNAAVTLLTELAYTQVHLLLAARRPAPEILSRLDAAASLLLTSDLNGDGKINYDDVVAWRPSSGDAGLRIKLADIQNLYLNQTDAGLAALEAVNSINLGAVAADADGSPQRFATVATARNTLFYALKNGSIAATNLNGTPLWNKTVPDSNPVSIFALEASQDWLAGAGCITVQEVTSCTTLYVAAAPASEAPSFKSLDLGAKILSVQVTGDKALVATANGLFDVDIAATPMVVVSTNNNTSDQTVANVLAATDTHVFALTSNKLTVLDRATLTSISSLSFEHDFSNVSDALFVDNHLVVAAGLAGILNFDVTDPVAPVEGNRIVSASNNEKFTAVKHINNTIVALGSSGLRSFTLNDAGDLQQTGRLFIRDTFPDGGMAATDTALFMGIDGGNSVATTAVSFVGGNSLTVGQLPIAGALTIIQQSNTLYVGASPSSSVEDSLGKVVKVDIATPASPTIAKEYPVSGGVNALSIHGDKIGIANPPHGYGVLDLTSGNFLSRNSDFPGTAVGITPEDQFDIVHNRNGLALFDTSNAAAPVAVFEPTLLTDSWNGVVKGSTLLQSQGSSGLGVMSVNGTEVSPIKSINTSDGAGWEGTLQSWSVALSGNTLYSAGCSSLAVLDVSAETAPRVLNQTASTPCVMQVTVAGSIAYARDSDGSVAVFDVTVPAQPIFVGLLPQLAPANYILAGDANVFLLEDSRILSVMNTIKALPPSIVK